MRQFLKTSRPAVAARKQKGIGESAGLKHPGMGRLAGEAKLEIGRSRKNDVTYKLRE